MSRYLAFKIANVIADQFAQGFCNVKMVTNFTEVIEKELLAQSEQALQEAFRAGVRYSAKKYTTVAKERFTGNDVALFLEMAACEVSDDDITKYLEENNE